MSTKMPPQSRGPLDAFERHIKTFDLSAPVTPDESTPRALHALSHPFPSFDGAADVSSEEDDADFQSHYSLDASPSSSSSSSGSPSPPQPNNAPPFLHSSSSAHILGANAFAPPFYNRPPTPLPPSPSLTSLLRPNFSATTSRPTTPDSSENDTLNDTEAVVAKSARTATTVSRVSPKVPTYEYYGFVLYLLSSGIFRTWSRADLPLHGNRAYLRQYPESGANGLLVMYLLWSYLPSPFLHQLGIHYYPDRWWSLAIPAFLVMVLVYIYLALALYNTEYLTLPMSSIENIVDDAANVAVLDSKGRIKKKHVKGQGTSSHTQGNIIDWKASWSEGTDAVMDVPIGGVCEILYADDSSVDYS